jgi:hypothetical protein
MAQLKNKLYNYKKNAQRQFSFALQPNSCNTHAEREWAQGTLLRQQKKFLQPTRSGFFFVSNRTRSGIAKNSE